MELLRKRGGASYYAPRERDEDPLLARDKRESLNAELELLKNRLVKTHLSQLGAPALLPVLKRAADDAAALVWTTPYPLLLLPVLLEEKTDVALQHFAHQEVILRRSRMASRVAA